MARSVVARVMINYRETPVEATCPVCGRTECRLLYAVDAQGAARHVTNDRVEPEHLSKLTQHIENLWHGPGCQFVRCQHCGFCFAWPYVPGDAVFYSMVYDAAYADGDYLPWNWYYQRTFEHLREIAGAGGGRSTKLLEIGAGNGAFVKRIAPALLPKENVFCIEYSDNGADEIRRYGIACSTRDIRQAELPPSVNRFDAICMFHVLEHMDDLDRLFQCLSRLANKGTNLFIATPNCVQRELYDRFGASMDVPPAHIGRWNKQCFEIMAERHGWILVSHENEPEEYLSKIRRYLYVRVNRMRFTAPLRRIRSRIARRLALSLSVPICALLSLAGIYALRRENTGVSQYAYLRKESNAGGETVA